MACIHVLPQNLAENLVGKLVHKDECVKCFASSVRFM